MRVTVAMNWTPFCELLSLVTQRSPPPLRECPNLEKNAKINGRGVVFLTRFVKQMLGSERSVRKVTLHARI